jgi:hypothetical protein
MISRFFIAPGIAVAVLTGGCSGSAANNGGDAGAVSSADEANDAAGTVACTGGETYSANMTAPGSLGVYTFTLVQSSPAPPAQYANVWTFKVTGASGAPDVSQLTMTPFMPLMGHGSDQIPTITANADGTFTAVDVYLFMAGLWTVTISVNALPDGGADASAHAPTPTVLDKAVYSFCVD